MNNFNLVNEAQRLLDKGIHLIELQKLSKRPKGNHWNNKSNRVIDINDTATGYGIPLHANNLCSIDVDHEELAIIGFNALNAEFDLGGNLEEILNHGVRTSSSRENSGGRSVYKEEESLKWIRFSSKATGTILELRANSANLQDCLPGTRYRSFDDSEIIYEQSYYGEKRLDNAEELPPTFAEFWHRLSTDGEFLHKAQEVFYKAVATHLGLSEEVFYGYKDTSVDGKLIFTGPYTASFNREHTVRKILERNGYIDHGHRLSAPKATGSPGIREIPGTDGLWQSDHASDPLHGIFDAWTAFVVLEHNGIREAAEDAYESEIHRQLIDDFTVLDNESKAALKEYELTDKPQATKFVLDGLIAEGISVLASYPGGGKTTAMVAIAAHVTQAMVPDPFLNVPTVTKPRHVLYFTEHPEQVALIVSAMIKEWMIEEKLFRNLFHIIPAKRISPDALSELANICINDCYMNPVTRNGITINVTPWIVFDTTSSMIDLEDENSNSEWGKAISKLKSSYVMEKNIPITLVTHTAKTGKDASDATKLTARGGSALEGDATQISFLVKNDDQRYINIQDSKHRFMSVAHSIKIQSKLIDMVTYNEFDEPIDEKVLACDLILMCEDDIKVASSEMENKRLEQACEENEGRVMEQIYENERSGNAMSKTPFGNMIQDLKIESYTGARTSGKLTNAILSHCSLVAIKKGNHALTELKKHKIKYPLGAEKVIVSQRLLDELGIVVDHHSDYPF